MPRNTRARLNRQTIHPAVRSSILHELQFVQCAEASNSRITDQDSVGERYMREAHQLPYPIPLSLYSLRDDLSSSGPDISLLIDLAIWSSPDRRLLLDDIYQTILERYPSWHTSSKQSWRQSIRHKLSRMARYTQKDRPVGCSGKGNFWIMDGSKGNALKPRQSNSKRQRESGRGSVNQRETHAVVSSWGRPVEEGWHMPPPQLYPRYPQYIGASHTAQADGWVWPEPTGWQYHHTMVPLGSGPSSQSQGYPLMVPPIGSTVLRNPFDPQSTGPASQGINPQWTYGPNSQRSRSTRCHYSPRSDTDSLESEPQPETRRNHRSGYT